MTPNAYEIVAASSTCRQLLGQKPRFYTVEAPQTKQTPYAVCQTISSIPANYLSQLPDMDDARVQIDVYDPDQLTVIAVATAIRDALEPHGYMVGSAERGRDPVTRNYGFMMDFEFFTAR